MEQDRQQKQPLAEKLADNRRRMSAAMSGDGRDEKQIQVLAGEQAQILQQMIMSNAEFQSKLYGTLTDEQKRKLDELRRSGAEGDLRAATASR